jgi:alpha-L-fucosidase
LLEIGAWLWVNGESIYGTRPWKVYGEGPTQVLSGGFTDTRRGAFTSEDIRFTTKGNVLYAILLGWPAQGEAVIRSLGSHLKLYNREIREVRLLGANEPVEWTRQSDGLKVKLPPQKPCAHAFVLKITPAA